MKAVTIGSIMTTEIFHTTFNEILMKHAFPNYFLICVIFDKF